MKAMKNYIWMAALALTAATLTACSSDELASNETPVEKGKVVTLTATLGPKDGTTTRALTDPGDGTLNSAWAVNEEICVQYTNNSGVGVSAKGIITDVTGGSATVTVNLVDPKDGNSDIFFHYPYDLAVGGRDLGSGQKGTLADIAAHYDDIDGAGTLNVSAGVATLPASVTMTRNICIWKLTLKNGSTDITSSITNLNIKVGTIKEYNIAPSSLSTIYVAMFAAIDQEVTVTATTADGVYSTSKTGRSFALRNLYTTTGLTLTPITNNVDLGSLSANYTANNGDVLTGTLDPNYHVTIADGATVILKNAVIEYGKDDAAPIACAGDATIILEGTNTLSVPGGVDDPLDPDNSQHMNGYPAILVGTTGTKLTISGSGTLNAVGGLLAPGIGCLHASYTGYGSNYYCGIIQIDGGTINSYSGHAQSLGDGAEVGIGAVCGGSSGDGCDGIIINGGIVTAEGGAAGIGGAGGTIVDYITINGGTITARSHNDGAGIGTTANGQCGPITITGGTIEAYGALSAAGIGTGCGVDDTHRSICGNITISGGNITASGDEAGIGSGAMGQCGNITITGGTINSSSLNGIGTGPGIGAGGNQGLCGAISISGGTIEAIGGSGSAGIGSAAGGPGYTGSYASLTISKGITKVTATKNSSDETAPIGRAGNDTTSPLPVFSGVTKDDVNSTADTWIYQ